MEFMHVQIPYRGGIPIINRRGPIADLELDIKTIKTLISYDIEVLDPSNGKPIAFQEEAPAPTATAAPKEDKPVEKKADEAATAPVAAAAVKPADEKKADEAAAIVTAPAAADPAAATAQEAAPSEEKAEDTAAADGDDDAVEGADAFDYTKIVNYSSLSKSKRKELRKFFAEKNGKMDINILYATLNEMSKK